MLTSASLLYHVVRLRLSVVLAGKRAASLLSFQSSPSIYFIKQRSVFVFFNLLKTPPVSVLTEPIADKYVEGKLWHQEQNRVERLLVSSRLSLCRTWL